MESKEILFESFYECAAAATEMSLFQQPDGSAFRGEVTYQAVREPGRDMGIGAFMFVCVHVCICVLGFIQSL